MIKGLGWGRDGEACPSSPECRRLSASFIKGKGGGLYVADCIYKINKFLGRLVQKNKIVMIIVNDVKEEIGRMRGPMLTNIRSHLSDNTL